MAKKYALSICLFKQGYIMIYLFGRYKLPRYMVLRSIFFGFEGGNFVIPPTQPGLVEDSTLLTEGSSEEQRDITPHQRSWSTFQGIKRYHPKAPWDVMGCQNHLFLRPQGVSLGGSGVSIGGVWSLRATWYQHPGSSSRDFWTHKVSFLGA